MRFEVDAVALSPEPQARFLINAVVLPSEAQASFQVSGKAKYKTYLCLDGL